MGGGNSKITHISWKAIFAPSGEVITREIAGEILLVPVRGRLADLKKLYSVNSVAGFIWKQMDGETSLEQIKERLMDRFDVSQSEADSDVLGFADELLAAGLVELRQ